MLQKNISEIFWLVGVLLVVISLVLKKDVIGAMLLGTLWLLKISIIFY